LEAFEGLEPCEGKLSRTVLRGLGGSNPVQLLDRGNLPSRFGPRNCTGLCAKLTVHMGRLASE